VLERGGNSDRAVSRQPCRRGFLRRRTGWSTAKKAKSRGTIASAASVFYRISTERSDGSLSGSVLVRGGRAPLFHMIPGSAYLILD